MQQRATDNPCHTFLENNADGHAFSLLVSHGRAFAAAEPRTYRDTRIEQHRSLVDCVCTSDHLDHEF